LGRPGGILLAELGEGDRNFLQFKPAKERRGKTLHFSKRGVHTSGGIGDFWEKGFPKNARGGF